MCILSDYPDYNTLNVQAICRLHDYGLVFRVGRFKSDVVSRLVKSLYRRVSPINQCNNRLPVFSRLARLDYDQVALADVIPNHRVSSNSQCVGAASSDHVARHVNRFVCQDCFDGLTGGDDSQQWYFGTFF
jgi:hypothetical protein